MAKLPSQQGNFDEPVDTFTPVLPGKYTAQINKSDYKETNESKKRGEQAIQKDPFGGHSYYQQYDFTILEGKYAGRIIFCRLHVKNRNQEVEEKENQRAHQLGKILGYPNFSDTEELHSLPMIIRVRTTKAKGKYPEGNDVNGFYPLEGDIGTDTNVSERATNEPGEGWDEDEETTAEPVTESKTEVVGGNWEDQIDDKEIPFSGDSNGPQDEEVSFD